MLKNTIIYNIDKIENMQKNQQNNFLGFTLIELLVVIVIIGILATMATVALNSAKQKTRDTKRISDIKQIQTALEVYYNDHGKYPASITFGSPLTSDDAVITYLNTIPSNPSPRNDGLCPGTNYTYSSDGTTYTITYCLGGNVAHIESGGCQATPAQICQHVAACACDDVTIACCSSCAVGSQCGGGILFNNNFNGYQLISYNFSNLTRPWKTAETYANLEGATSTTDGLANSDLLDGSDFAAAQYCLDKTDNGFNDWYLPARDELCNLFRNSNLCTYNWPCAPGCEHDSILNGALNNIQYWTSTEIDDIEDNKAYAIYTGTQTYTQTPKFDSLRTWCIRRQ